MKGHVLGLRRYINLAEVVLWAWEVAEGTHLDPGLPLEWNRHQVWICFTSLVLVVQLRECLMSMGCEKYIRERLKADKVEKILIV